VRVRDPGPDLLRDVPDQLGVDPVGLRLHDHDLHSIHPLPEWGSTCTAELPWSAVGVLRP